MSDWVQMDSDGKVGPAGDLKWGQAWIDYDAIRAEIVDGKIRLMLMLDGKDTWALTSPKSITMNVIGMIPVNLDALPPEVLAKAWQGIR